MKKLFGFLILLIFGNSLFSQFHSYKDIVFRGDFINWVSKAANNEWEINLDFKRQLGDRFDAFHNKLVLTSTDQQISDLITSYRLNTDYSFQLMAEHIAYGFIFRKNNEWVYQLDAQTRLQLIKDAFYTGMSSSDSRWVSLKNYFSSKTQSANASRIMPSDVVDCIWGTVKAAFGFTSITALYSAFQTGSFSEGVAAIKSLLKKSGFKWGWWGLAIAAIDIGICIWNS